MSIQRRKRKNIRKKYLLILLILLIVVYFVCFLPNIILSKKNNEILKKADVEVNEGKSFFKYSVFDVYKVYQEEKNEEVLSRENITEVYYQENYEIQLVVDEFLENSSYWADIKINNESKGNYPINNKEEKVNIYFEKEGKNDINVIIKKDNNTIQEYNKIIYYIKPYEKQYLEELSNQCISTRPEYMTELSNHILVLKSLGINQVRTDILLTSIYKNGNSNFINTDKWTNKYIENGISIEAVLNTDKRSNLFGNDGKISSQEELDYFIKMVDEISYRYPQIKKYEIINEPNFYYTSEEDIKWYSKIIENSYNILKNKDINNKVIAGATAIIGNGGVDSIPFLKAMSNNKTYQNSNEYSAHFYDFSNNGKNTIFLDRLKTHNQFMEELGGFQNLNISEFGVPSSQDISNEKQQAEKIVQQSNILKEKGIKDSSIYCFKNRGNDNNEKEDNFGLINNDYTPKPSYYSMKNYYENTNGSEYIGAVNIAEGLEAHVYNKDGKPKIVAWSNNSNKNIEIDYLDFTAKDIYGNNIENTNGKLTITTSPVYLDNISEKYYYMAISKTATEKYNEFENKYIEEIKKVTNLNTNIQTMKKYMAEVGNATLGVPEDLAKKAMQQHYTLGKNILDAYKNGELKVEHVKLSSMLDSLDDIGNSYEDLVTVSSKIRNVELNKANDQIKEVENIINSNTDLEIIYPEKILEFSKDYHEKSSYINGLQEENDIKTGLIVSKNMHSIELSNWAKLFTNIYIEEHIKNNPITVNYSQAEITNKDVQVTLNISEDCKVTNNNENNVYTFVENGEFTFEYTRRGRNFSEKVSVNNIDKKAPEIKGVEGWKVYTGKAIPIVTDENLEKVELILNGQVVDGYKEGTEITEEGIYQITATDKAGNISRVNFEVIENIEKGYKIEKGYIKNITGSTQKTDFENQLPIKYKYTIKRNEKEIDKDGIVATGDMLEIEGKEKYTLIVNGDINKDGIVSILDLVKIKRQILGELKLEGIEKQAADANQDGKEIGIKDLVRMRILILSRGINN